MNTPPRKRAGQATGPRRLDGDITDVAGATVMLWGKGGSEKMTRARVARGELPYRRLNGRIIFIKSELSEYVRRLPGVTLDEAVRNVATRAGGTSSQESAE